MAEGKDELSLVFAVLVEEERSFRILLTDPCKPPLIGPYLGKRMNLFLLTVIKIDDDLGIAGTKNVIEIPPLYFDNDNTKIRCDHNKIRIPVVDIWFVINQIIIG